MSLARQHIVFVNTSTIWGGGEKWHLDTALELHRAGMQVTLMCHPGSQLQKLASVNGLKTHELVIHSLSFLNPFKLIALVQLLSSLRAQVVIFNSPREMKLVAPAAYFAGISHVIFRRGLPRPISNNIFYRWLFRRCISLVIANSAEIARSLNWAHATLVPAEKIKVIYNGLDLAAFDRQPCQPLTSRRPDEITLGSAGRLVKQKNHQALLQVVAKLKSHGVKIKLLLAGVGPLEQALREQCQQLGIQQQVDFVGYQGNIKDLLASIDIFVLPSLYEGSAHVLLEAAAFKLPVVAFEVSSNPELVEHEKSGLLVPAGDTDAMCQQLLRLSLDPQLRIQLGEHGREMVASRYSARQASASLHRLILRDAAADTASSTVSG